MISDILEHEEGARLEADAIVVGSGVAGTEVALTLERRGFSVIMLESGREAFDPAIQALNDVVFAGKPHRTIDADAPYHRYLPPELRGASRLRRFGGTSNIWTGKWKHLQRSDFESRPWVPNSDWPIDFDTLLPHYRAAAHDYGFADLEAEARRPEVMALRDEIAEAGLKLSSFYWEETPTRTRIRFGEAMRRSDRVHVVLGATVAELIPDASGRVVESVVCKSLEGRSISAHARCVVLATGGVETPRLLLVSNRGAPHGIGNAHDLVGRFYTDHPKHHSGVLRPGPLARRFAREFQYQPKPRFCVCFALDDETQRARGLLEHVIYLKPIYETRRDRIARLLRRRPACRDGRGVVRAYRVKYVSEQVPDPKSRVRLSEETDPLGMRRAVVDWRFTPQDHASIAEVIDLATSRFSVAGLGEFDFGSDPPSIDTMTDAAHQMGTTRMAADPGHGVVDRDCRVFGTENLFVAGSAVFPTGPSYSPTFTILALARRLGEHLSGESGVIAAPRATGTAV